MPEEALREERSDHVERAFDTAAAPVTDGCIEPRSPTEFGYERLDKVFTALSAGIARLERKLDRILALVVESRTRNR